MKSKLEFKIPEIIVRDQNLLKQFNTIYNDLLETSKFVVDDKKRIEDLIEQWNYMPDVSAKEMVEKVDKKTSSFFKAIADVEDSWEDSWKDGKTDFMEDYKVGSLTYGLWATRLAYILSFLSSEEQERWFTDFSSKADTFNDLTWRNRTFDEKALDYFCNSKNNQQKRYAYVLNRLSEFKKTEYLSKNSFQAYIGFYEKLENTAGWCGIFDEDVPLLLSICDSKTTIQDKRNFYILFNYIVLDGAVTQKDKRGWMGIITSVEDLMKLIIKYVQNSGNIKEQIGRAAYNMATRLSCQLNMSISDQPVLFIMDKLIIEDDDLHPYGSDNSKRPGDTTRRSITLSELKYALYLIYKKDAKNIKFYMQGKRVEPQELLKNQAIQQYVDSIARDPNIYAKMNMMTAKL